MDLKLVDCFLRVAEQGSINRAAADLEMTQPALSRRLDALEHELGVQLMVRHARGIRLTDAGMLLAKGAPSLVRQAELLRSEIGKSVNTQVSIGLPFSLHHMVTAPFASAEVKRNPAISLRVYEGFIHQLNEWMQNGLIDVAVMESRRDEKGLQEHTELVREQLLLVGPADSGLSVDMPVDADYVGDCRFIVPGRPNIIRQEVESYLKRHGKKFRRAADAETLQLCLSLVKDGLGYTVMPYCALHEHPYMNSLRAAPIAGLAMTWSLYVNQARRHHGGVRTTARNLKQMMLGLVKDRQWPFATPVV